MVIVQMNLCHDMFVRSLSGALNGATIRRLKEQQCFQTTVNQIGFLYLCVAVHNPKGLNEFLHDQMSDF